MPAIVCRPKGWHRPRKGVRSACAAFPDKRRLREIASEISLASGIILSVLVVDRQTMQERGDFSLFDDIRDEGIAV